MALQGMDAMNVITELDERMRQIVKYEKYPSAEKAIVEELRTALREMCEEHHLTEVP